MLIISFSYPDATTEDLENSDVCIICRENMVGNGSCKKLPCNHIFHVTCLRSWFQRQQTCPTCRMDVLRVNSQTSNANNNEVNANANQNNNNNNNNANANGPMPPFPPIFPGHPVFQHFQQLFQRNNNQNENNNNNNNNGPNVSNTTNVSSTNSTAGTNLPLPPLIPPSILPFLHSPPFPMPQINELLLQGFSDRELKLLEGSERRNIEARIKCLMEVKTLINAATLRLQQYNNVVINSQRQVSIATQTESASILNYNSNSSSHNVDSLASTSIINSGDNSDEKELIRQRRLQHFTQPEDDSDSSQLQENHAQNES